MKKYCQNPSCENEAMKEVSVSIRKPSDRKRTLCAACHKAYTWGVQYGQMATRGLLVEPPPQDQGPEPLYRVVYAIDVNAPDMRQAAERAYELMQDLASMRPVLDVLESSGERTRIDLSEE
jgi:hypothetical protein